MNYEKKPIPFEFILDYLYPIVPVVKPMFGCYALYAGEKIILIVRERKDHIEDNGVWLATSIRTPRKPEKRISFIAVYPASR